MWHLEPPPLSSPLRARLPGLCRLPCTRLRAAGLAPTSLAWGGRTRWFAFLIILRTLFLTNRGSHLWTETNDLKHIKKIFFTVILLRWYEKILEREVAGSSSHLAYLEELRGVPRTRLRLHAGLRGRNNNICTHGVSCVSLRCRQIYFFAGLRRDTRQCWRQHCCTPTDARWRVQGSVRSLG